MSQDIHASNLQYAAALLKKMISTLSSTDPSAAEISRLTGPMLELTLAVLGEGRDKNARGRRLKVEAEARGLDPLLLEIESADPFIDLGTLQTSNWRPFDLADVMAEEIPPISWLVKPYLPRPGVTVWFGKPKALKSLLVLDMCLHVAGGYPWLASDPTGKDSLAVMPARVVWVDLENGAITLKRRMKAIASVLGMGKAHDQLQAYSMPDPWPDLSKTENAAAMINRLQALGDIGILVIDHLGQVFGAVDENSALVSQIMGTIRQISEACNLAIVLIHHARKGGIKEGGSPEDQLRGSGAIMASVDAAFLIERDKSDKMQLKLIPVAVRGPDAPNLSAQFAYEQDENLDLVTARFWRMAWRNNASRARDAILAVLKGTEKNHTELRSAVKQMEPNVSDQNIRDAISVLEGTKEIYFVKGDKGAKIYHLTEENEYEN